MPATVASAHALLVQQYYDRNTRRFLRWGQGSGTTNIHRAVWGQGVQTPEDAMQYVNQQVLDAVAAHTSGTRMVDVVDLGCGVGSSIFYLALRLPAARFWGVTLSPAQVHLAQQHPAYRHLAGRCTFHAHDFHDLSGLPHFDVAYAIESFIHADQAERFFASVARQLRPGGRLMIVDDFLTHRGATAQGHDARRLAAFRQGWMAPSVITPAEATAAAARHGLVLRSDADLTAHLALRRPRDRAIGMAVRLLGPLTSRSMYLRSLSGGHALQQCLHRGLVAYRHLTFVKPHEA